MEVEDCKCYCSGTHYLVWQDIEQGVFIMHIGGPLKRELFRMFKAFLKSQCLGKDVFFATQKDTYWRNNSERDYRFRNAEIFKYTGRR